MKKQDKNRKVNVLDFQSYKNKIDRKKKERAEHGVKHIELKELFDKLYRKKPDNSE